MVLGKMNCIHLRIEVFIQNNKTYLGDPNKALVLNWGKPTNVLRATLRSYSRFNDAFSTFIVCFLGKFQGISAELEIKLETNTTKV